MNDITIARKEWNKGFETKNKMIPVENLTEGMWYAFTYNPLVQPIIKDRVVHVDDWLIQQRRHFGEYDNRYCDLIMYMESSTSGRLHWHGCIRLHDIAGFMLKVYPLIVIEASTEIDYLTDKDIWFNYCTKQLKVFKESYQSAELGDRSGIDVNPVNGNEVCKDPQKKKGGLGDLVPRVSKANKRVCTCTFKGKKYQVGHQPSCIFG